MKVKNHCKLGMSLVSALIMHTAFSAKPIDLRDQTSHFLLPYLKSTTARANNSSSYKEISKHTDFNQTTHIRIQETYAGYPVWGSDAIVHIPKGSSTSLSTLATDRAPNKTTMNGHFYEDLSTDLANTPSSLADTAEQSHALNYAISLYQSESGLKSTVSSSQISKLVYVDTKNVAHWVYHISFLAQTAQHPTAKPAYILDANSFEIYQHWNDLKTLDNVEGGGIGGNEGKVGKLSYDGLTGHFPKLDFQRDSKKQICYLKNSLTVVKNRKSSDSIPQFKCAKTDDKHNNIYWNTTTDSANGGYSPNNDVLYSDKITRQMYTEWFDVPMLVKNGKPMQVTMHVHDPYEGQNAYYDNGMMVFGEGDDESYPVVAPSVVAHEMSHGFTEQHSNLVYNSQSGGLNESFSDMADKAVEYYVYGKNEWQIDPELLKEGGRLLRWMDDPTQDCYGKKPGNSCSIAHMKDYYPGLNVHYSSGIFNRAFYLIATNWNDTKKAFEVMTHANISYWTSTTSFADAACGVIKATQDYKYDVTTVVEAFKEVGIKVSADC